MSPTLFVFSEKALSSKLAPTFTPATMYFAPSPDSGVREGNSPGTARGRVSSGGVGLSTSFCALARIAEPRMINNNVFFMVGFLGHHDSVARLDRNVVFVLLALDHICVV